MPSPRAVASPRPPPSAQELGNRDTELPLGSPDLQRKEQAAQVSALAPGAPATSWFWLVAVLAALIGIAAGVALSMTGG